MKQLELDLGQNTQSARNTCTTRNKMKNGLGKLTAVTKNTSRDVGNKTSTPANKSKNSEYPFDETSRRTLARRPRFEKDYQKDLTFYLTKACEYLPWRFYVEVELDFLGRQRFIDIVLKTESSQHILMDLKRGVITIDMIEKVLEKEYLEAYRKRTKKGKYPLLYIIGEDFTPEAEEYSKKLTKQWELKFKRFKYKPRVLVRNYAQLMEFLDKNLEPTEIGAFELGRMRRDVPLLYEGHSALHEGQDG